MNIKNFFIKTKTYEKYGVTETEQSVRLDRVITVAVALIIALVLCFLMIRTVPTGYTGILTTFGKVEDKTIDAGVHIIAPWQKIIKLDNRSQKVEIQTDAFSSDIQQVQVTASINYSINQQTAHTLYKTVGKNYYENIILPRILENIKAVFANYTAENLISNRAALSDEIANAMRVDMETYGINVTSLAIEDIDFTEAFTDAVEAKQVAAQEKLTAETVQAQKTMEKEQEAERAIIQANAEAEQAVIAANAELEVVKIQAEAALYSGEKEAEANRRIAESLTAELVRYYYIKQWNGQLPTTVLGEDNSFMLNLEK